MLSFLNNAEKYIVILLSGGWGNLGSKRLNNLAKDTQPAEVSKNTTTEGWALLIQVNENWCGKTYLPIKVFKKTTALKGMQSIWDTHRNKLKVETKDNFSRKAESKLSLCSLLYIYFLQFCQKMYSSDSKNINSPMKMKASFLSQWKEQKGNVLGWGYTENLVFSSTPLQYHF